MKKDNWNANLYDESHSFVSSYGEDVVTLLAPKKGEKILDLGSGTGDLANEIHHLGAYVVGIDQSKSMVQQAKHKYGHLEFHVGDANGLNFTEEFDAVFSNAVLHWVKTPKQALQCIYQSLKTGGRFVAELGGKDNIQLITSELQKQFNLAGTELTAERFPWNYPSVGEYTTLMEEVGFRVTFAAHLDRPTPLKGYDGLKNWLDMFTGSMFTDIDEGTKELILSNTVSQLKDVLFHDGEWIADYKRLRVVGIKE